jgi:thiamine transport system permease protein
MKISWRGQPKDGLNSIGTQSGWLSPLLMGLPLVFLLVFFVYPLGSILVRAGQQTIKQGLGSLDIALVGRPLFFTFYQAGLSTLLTLLVGLPAAFVVGRFDFPGRAALRVLTTLPFMLPAVVVAAGFNALLGPHGWLNLALMAALRLTDPPIALMNTFGMILLAHVFYNLTVVVRVVGSAWEGLDPRLEQAARTLGASPWRAFRAVSLPLLRPAIVAAAMLVFLFDFTSFGVVLLLGGPRFATLEVEIYIQALQMLNLPAAGMLSLIQLGCTLLFSWVYARLNHGSPAVPLAPRVKGEGLRRPRSWRERLAVILASAFLAVLVLAPLGALALRSVVRLEAERGQRGDVQYGLTLDYYQELFVNRRQSIFYVPPFDALRNSLGYAFTTVLISLGIGFPTAYALLRRGRAVRGLDLLLTLPMGTSAVTLGLGYVLTFNHPPLDVRSFPLLIPLAHSLVALPLVVRTLQPAIAAIPHSLHQAASMLGASPVRAWREVDLPLLSRAALVGAVFAFTISLGEFGATTMLARPDMPTLPVAIAGFLAHPGALNYGQAMAMATLLMLACAGAVFLLERFQEG